jgi:hypothetical protein
MVRAVHGVLAHYSTCVCADVIVFDEVVLDLHEGVWHHSLAVVGSGRKWLAVVGSGARPVQLAVLCQCGRASRRWPRPEPQTTSAAPARLGGCARAGAREGPTSMLRTRYSTATLHCP